MKILSLYFPIVLLAHPPFYLCSISVPINYTQSVLATIIIFLKVSPVPCRCPFQSKIGDIVCQLVMMMVKYCAH